jgi:hypothetical protein
MNNSERSKYYISYLLPDEEWDEDEDLEEEPEDEEPDEDPDEYVLLDPEDTPPDEELLYDPDEKLRPLSALLLEGTEYCLEELEGEPYLFCMVFGDELLLTLFPEFWFEGTLTVPELPEELLLLLTEPLFRNVPELVPSEIRLLLYDGRVLILGLL